MPSQPSNPISTSGSGFHFEAHVQAMFVTLMLSGGLVPHMPPWPISRIKLQGRDEGYETDDVIVWLKDPTTGEERRLICQIKRTIHITKTDKPFKDSLQGMWEDFNAEWFHKDRDILLLICRQSSFVDSEVGEFLINQAKSALNVEEFERKVRSANFGPVKRQEKLEIIREILEDAKGAALAPQELLEFLKSFLILNIDLGTEYGMTLPLLLSHILPFQTGDPYYTWARIVEHVHNVGQIAGCIVKDNIPEDLRELFKPRSIIHIPIDLALPTELHGNPMSGQETLLAQIMLVGAWDERSDSDRSFMDLLIGGNWIDTARQALHPPYDVLTVKNGRWRVLDRETLWTQLGTFLYDEHLVRFSELTTMVLTEQDPALDMDINQRHLVGLKRRQLNCSAGLRKGLAEALAILSTRTEVLNNCSVGKIRDTVILTVRNILEGAGWKTWASLGELLPLLAEAAPTEFLQSIERTLRKIPSPFDEMFTQESGGLFGRTYISGILWALERLAWSEDYLARVSLLLGELAARDPGGSWSNRPINSLVSLFLPWFPQTLAGSDMRRAAVGSLVSEFPDVAWDLLRKLMPGACASVMSNNKPIWFLCVPESWEPEVSYKQDVAVYVDMIIKLAAENASRLRDILPISGTFSSTARDQFAEEMACLSTNDGGLELWESINHYLRKARRNKQEDFDEAWLLRLEELSVQLKPADPASRNREWFIQNTSYLYEGTGDWEEKKELLRDKRVAAIRDVFAVGGLEAIMSFADIVENAIEAGRATAVFLGAQGDVLLPSKHNASKKQQDFIAGYVNERFHQGSWNWVDTLDRTGWSLQESATLLCNLEFTSEAWERVRNWLGVHEEEYWSHVSVRPNEEQALPIAAEKLLQVGRADEAVYCLHDLLQSGMSISTDLCIRALEAAIATGQLTQLYYYSELIKMLQENPDVSEAKLLDVEFKYLSLLEADDSSYPKTIEHCMAREPELFHYILTIVYSSDKIPSVTEPNEEQRTKASIFFQLLHQWRTPPGTISDGSFVGAAVETWTQDVQTLCMESGHWEVACITIGTVMTYSPADEDGLWIHRAVAAELNKPDREGLRRGFEIGIRNRRGVHVVDPTGESERQLAEQYELQAKALDLAGYARFAATIRKLACSYRFEAEQASEVIDDRWSAF